MILNDLEQRNDSRRALSLWQLSFLLTKLTLRWRLRQSSSRRWVFPGDTTSRDKNDRKSAASLVSRLLRSLIAVSLSWSRALSASSCRIRSTGSDRSTHRPTDCDRVHQELSDPRDLPPRNNVTMTHDFQLADPSIAVNWQYIHCRRGKYSNCDWFHGFYNYFRTYFFQRFLF